MVTLMNFAAVENFQKLSVVEVVGLPGLQIPFNSVYVHFLK